MKFLCGRPGCGKESTATLQIDAPSETVSLVDPRVSRDGVPLCARHADATTPPMGWTMNDLRSRNRGLAAVPDEGTVPTSTPPRVRPEPSVARQMSRRQSIAERAVATGEVDPAVGRQEAPAAGSSEAADDHKFRSSRPAASASTSNPADDAPAVRPKRSVSAEEGPDSRPTRRRDMPEEVEEPEERFPWHHQYNDDEPEEMQASSPLLSRAFRSSTG